MARLSRVPLPGGFYARLGGKLGIPRIRSDHDLAVEVEKRLPAATIQSLLRGGLSDAEVYELIVPRRLGAPHGPAPTALPGGIR